MRIGIDKGNRSKKYAIAAKRMNIPFVYVDCSKTDIIEKLNEIDILIWHWTQDQYIDKRIALAIIKSAEIMGKIVYPNIKTSWMFDDKISEKYLLEAVKAPLVETKVFFNENDVVKWARKEGYPIVYKLPQGAGSCNVRLINDLQELKKICKLHFSFWGRPDIFMNIHNSNKNVKQCIDEIRKNQMYRYGCNNRGFVLLQKFVPNNLYDIRVTIIGERGIIFKRQVRDNDFRASGSGRIDYMVSKKDLEAIPIARRISQEIGSQTMTYDFLRDNGVLKIVEMSYGFSASAVYNSLGWYDSEMNFHEEKTDVHQFVINTLIDEYNSKKSKMENE